MKKLKSFLIPVGLLIVVLTLVVIFYEAGLGDIDECWDIGDQMAVGKPHTIIIPDEEAKELFGGDIDTFASGTAEVGTAAYYHFKCHQDNLK